MVNAVYGEKYSNLEDSKLEVRSGDQTEGVFETSKPIVILAKSFLVKYTNADNMQQKSTSGKDKFHDKKINSKYFLDESSNMGRVNINLVLTSDASLRNTSKNLHVANDYIGNRTSHNRTSDVIISLLSPRNNSQRDLPSATVRRNRTRGVSLKHYGGGSKVGGGAEDPAGAVFRVGSEWVRAEEVALVVLVLLLWVAAVTMFINRWVQAGR